MRKNQPRRFNRSVSRCLAPPRYVEKAFNVVSTSEIRRCPGPLEILLVPHIGVAVLVHAPIGEPRGYPVPLGFVSFDENRSCAKHTSICWRGSVRILRTKASTGASSPSSPDKSPSRKPLDDQNSPDSLVPRTVIMTR